MRLLASQSAADKSLSETKSCMFPMPELRRNRMFAAVNLIADSCRSIGNVDQLQPLRSSPSPASFSVRPKVQGLPDWQSEAFNESLYYQKERSPFGIPLGSSSCN